MCLRDGGGEGTWLPTFLRVETSLARSVRSFVLLALSAATAAAAAAPADAAGELRCTVRGVTPAAGAASAMTMRVGAHARGPQDGEEHGDQRAGESGRERAGESRRERERAGESGRERERAGERAGESRSSRQIDERGQVAQSPCVVHASCCEVQ